MTIEDREGDDVGVSGSVGTVSDAGRPAALISTSAGEPQRAGTPGPDFVWRFRINEKPAQAMLDHPLDELLRVQWEELLKLCVPMFQGQPVKVDGFATMREPQRILPIFSDDPRFATNPSAIYDKARER